MKKILPFLVIMSVGFFSFADWVDHPIGFNVWIPNEWAQETGENLFRVRSPDGATAVHYLIVDASNLDEALDKLITELSAIMKNPEIVRKKEKVRVNGIPGIITGGIGYIPCTLMDVKIRWLVGILQYRNKALMVVGFAANASFDENEADIKEMLSSIRNLWLQHPIGIDVWIPPDWIVKTEKKSLLVTSPDGEVKINYKIINAPKLAKALNQIQVNLKKDLSGVRVVEDAEEFTVSGLNGVITSGTGNLKGLRVSGEVIKWMASIIFYKKKSLLISAMATASSFDKYKTDIRKMLRSLKQIE